MYEYDYGYDATAVPEDYMLQEDEWEREGLLDPAWEKQQKKVGEIHGIVVHLRPISRYVKGQYQWQWPKQTVRRTVTVTVR